MSRSIFIDWTPEAPPIMQTFVADHLDLRGVYVEMHQIAPKQAPRMFCRVHCDACQKLSTSIKRWAFEWPWSPKAEQRHDGRWQCDGMLIKTLENGLEYAYCKRCFKYYRSKNRHITKMDDEYTQTKKMISKAKREIKDEQDKNDRAAP